MNNDEIEELHESCRQLVMYPTSGVALGRFAAAVLGCCARTYRWVTDLEDRIGANSEKIDQHHREILALSMITKHQAEEIEKLQAQLAGRQKKPYLVVVKRDVMADLRAYIEVVASSEEEAEALACQMAEEGADDIWSEHDSFTLEGPSVVVAKPLDEEEGT